MLVPAQGSSVDFHPPQDTSTDSRLDCCFWFQFVLLLYDAARTVYSAGSMQRSGVCPPVCPVSSSRAFRTISAARARQQASSVSAVIRGGSTRTSVFCPLR